MSVVVIGCGRSGTNITLEILRGSPQLIASLEPENKNLCDGSIYDSYYLTKCDTWYFKPDQLVVRQIFFICMNVISISLLYFLQEFLLLKWKMFFLI